jgi:hypothetical protein
MSGSALSVFSSFANSYIPGNVKKYYPGVSLQACAQICARDPTCLSFEAGTSGRAGDCFTSTVNRNSAGVTFISNMFVFEIFGFDSNSRQPHRSSDVL